jgi:hypothetical protein
MDINEVLQFVDDVVYAKKGKHLNDLQRAIIEGTLKRQKYSEIADTCCCSEGHVKDMGYELLQVLSDAFGEPIDKGNLKSVLERQGNLTISFGDNSNTIGNINICSDKATTSDINQSQTPKFKEYQDKTKMETVNKLRQFGLGDEQIAEALGLTLDEVKQVDSED